MGKIARTIGCSHVTGFRWHTAIQRSIAMTQTYADTTERAQRPEEREEWQVMGDELVATVKQLLREGNVRRIIIKHEGQAALEIPLTIGVVGTLLAPWLAAVGALGALLTHCTIEVVRTERSGDPSMPQD
jgi:Domain of unknown function (DUF4342)